MRHFGVTHILIPRNAAIQTFRTPSHLSSSARPLTHRVALPATAPVSPLVTRSVTHLTCHYSCPLILRPVVLRE